MPTQITFNIAALPEGFNATPQEFAEMLVERMSAVISGEALSGQIGGAEPTTDVGLYVDTVGRKIMLWSIDDGQYVDTKSVPIGLISLWPGSGAPSDPDYLLVEGQVLDSEDYPDLYDVVGDTYNDGTESPGYFRLPDLKGRVPVGVGTGDYASPRTDSIATVDLGEKFGQEWMDVRGRVSVPMNNAKTVLLSNLTQVSNNDEVQTFQPPSLGLNYVIKAK